MSLLADKTILVTGATRGFGKAFCVKAASEGANLILVSKAVHLNNANKDTIFTMEDDIKKNGGSAVAVQTDIRYDDQVERAVNVGLEHFGQLDAVVHAANVFSASSSVKTDMSSFDLMHQINLRSFFLLAKFSANHLADSTNPHILCLAPSNEHIDECNYANSAYGLNMLGLNALVRLFSKEFVDSKIAVNALWPKQQIHGLEKELFTFDDENSEPMSPGILAHAALQILNQPSKSFNGQFCFDQDLIKMDSSVSLEDFYPEQIVD